MKLRQMKNYWIVSLLLLAISLFATVSAYADGWKYYYIGDTRLETGANQRRYGWQSALYEFDTVQVFASLSNPKDTPITNPEPEGEYPLITFTFAGAGYTPMEAVFSHTTSKEITLEGSIIGHVYTTYSNLGFTQVAKLDGPKADIVKKYESITLRADVHYYLQFGSVDLTKRPQITALKTDIMNGQEYTLYEAGTPYLHSDLSTYDLTGYVLGGPITWPKDSMYGLTRVTEPGIPSNGVYTRDSAAIIAQKERSLAMPVTIRYLDENNQEIHEEKMIDGYVGNPYDASTDEYKLTIDTYTLDENRLPENAIGTLSSQAQTVTYIYKKNPVKAQDVSIHYVDQNGKKIHEAQAISGFIGDTYDASSDKYKLAIDGYSLDVKKLPDNIKGTFSDQEQIVTFVYSKNAVKAKDVSVHYVDQNGKKIHEAQAISGFIGDTYDASSDKYKLSIDGYSLDVKKLPDNIKGTFSDQEQIVTFVYSKNAVKAKDVSVHYVDQNGKKIHEAQAISGFIGDTYDASSDKYKLAIDGYSLDVKKLPDNIKGTFSDQEQIVTFVYSKKEKPVLAKGTVTTQYVDEQGNTLAPEEAQTGVIGEAYTTKEKSLTGYTLVQSKLPTNATGTFTEKPITVTYVYAKQQKPVVTDKTTTTPGSKTTTTANAAALPKTGEQHSILLTVLGSAILFIAGWFFYKEKLH